LSKLRIHLEGKGVAQTILTSALGGCKVTAFTSRFTVGERPRCTLL